MRQVVSPDSTDNVCSVFVNKKSNPSLVFVFLAAEIELVAYVG